MALVIRSAQPADASAWLRMRSALWPGDDHASEIDAFFANRAAEPEAVLVALLEAEPVAVCELSVRIDVPGAEGKKTGFVEGLYVEPAHRSGTVALSLLKAARAWAKQRRCDAFGSDRDDRFVLDPRFASRRNPNQGDLVRR